MNRSTIITIVVVIVVAAVGAFILWPKHQEQPVPTPEPVEQPQVEKSVTPPPAPPIVEAPKAPEPQPEEPQAATEEPAPEAAPETSEQAAAPEDPFGGKPITIETLTGCKEVQQMGESQITIEYAPNGEWKVNGNLRAKWTIEGGRVKIYKDGTDEVHYIDIVNNKLVYNGKELNMTR